jgi:hypothetical protein
MVERKWASLELHEVSMLRAERDDVSRLVALRFTGKTKMANSR